MAAKTDHPGAAGLTTEEFNAIIALYAAFERGDGALLEQAITEGWQDIPLTPGQASGRDGMKPVIAAFHASFSDLKVVVHEVVGAVGRAGFVPKSVAGIPVSGLAAPSRVRLS